jgi:hypothetical protein
MTTAGRIKILPVIERQTPQNLCIDPDSRGLGIFWG